MIVSPKIKMEAFDLDKIDQSRLHLGCDYNIYLSFVLHVSFSCPDYHQDIDTKNRTDGCKDHIISCFSKSGEFYEYFVEIYRSWSNDKATTKRCEMIASTLKYFVVPVISNLNKNKPIRSTPHMECSTIS